VADKKGNKTLHPEGDVDEERRSFLRQSVYAAYATPLITALLVEEAAAKQSCTSEMKARCEANNYKWGWCKKCRRP
jgi:hypothetical protein